MGCLFIFLIASSLISELHCVNILSISNVVSTSHHIFHEVLHAALVDKGYNITMLAYGKKGFHHENYTVLTFEGDDKIFLDGYMRPPCDRIDSIVFFFIGVCRQNLESKQVRALQNYPKDFFDLVLWDLNGGDCLLPLINHFNDPPIVGISPYGRQPYIDDYMGNKHIYTYVPNSVTVPTDKVTFFDRIYNSFEIIRYIYTWKYYYLPVINEMNAEHYGDKVTKAEDTIDKVSLVLLLTDVVLDFPQTFPPNMIPIGGLHIARSKPLPKSLQKLLDGSKSGVVFFSLGSNIKAEKLPETTILEFNKCFGKLPYDILWKIDTKISMPKNVVTNKWLPQNDILAHKNVKLFISHGGALGTQEAMYHSVPVIGIPFNFDQLNNIDKIVARKLGKKVPLDTLTSDNLCNAINEVIGNAVYKENMDKISRRFKDQQNTPLERAVFWIEYVLRHKTGEHLKLAASEMNYIQTLNIDIIFTFFIITSLILALTTYICIKLYRKLLAKSKKEKIN